MSNYWSCRVLRLDITSSNVDKCYEILYNHTCNQQQKFKPNRNAVFNFKRLKSEIKKLVNYDYNHYIAYRVDSVNFNTQCFWNYVKSVNRSANIPNTMTFRNCTSNNTKTICEMFAKFFQNVYATHRAHNFNNFLNPVNCNNTNQLINRYCVLKTKPLKIWLLIWTW